MSEWKTLKKKTIEVGGNNFIEVNLKQPPEGDNFLIGISKGWYNESKLKRYKANILFSKENIQKLIQALEELDLEDEIEELNIS